jgi:hypothetical protein
VVTPDQAPAAWVAYAMSSMKTITAWLNVEPVGVTLH